MDKRKEAGGPAFPRTEAGNGNTMATQSHEGMTLRDYFAIHSGLFLNDARIRYEDQQYCTPWNDLSPRERLDALVTYRYQYADAMLKERDKWKKQQYS